MTCVLVVLPQRQRLPASIRPLICCVLRVSLDASAERSATESCRDRQSDDVDEVGRAVEVVHKQEQCQRSKYFPKHCSLWLRKGWLRLMRSSPSAFKVKRIKKT